MSYYLLAAVSSPFWQQFFWRPPTARMAFLYGFLLALLLVLLLYLLVSVRRHRKQQGVLVHRDNGDLFVTVGAVKQFVASKVNQFSSVMLQSVTVFQVGSFCRMHNCRLSISTVSCVNELQKMRIRKSVRIERV